MVDLNYFKKVICVEKGTKLPNGQNLKRDAVISVTKTLVITMAELDLVMLTYLYMKLGR